MANYQLQINSKSYEVDVEPDMPLLWVLRDVLHLHGTKFGCGIGQCGACTVHINHSPIKSCLTPISSINGASVITIEGLSESGDHPLQEAWVEENVPQCGYCQSGQIMSAAGLLQTNPQPSDAEIDSYMSANICRCGTYPRIKKAIKRASNKIS